MRKLIFPGVLFWCLLVSAHAFTIGEIARVDSLLTLMDLRLRISEDVARAKWNSHGAIEDPARETQVMEAFASQASSYSVDPQFAARFMRAQIEASKERQRKVTRRWRLDRHPPFPYAPDLARDIRPRLDALAIRLQGALAEGLPVIDASPDLLRWRVQVLWGDSPDEARMRALSPWLAQDFPTRR